MYIFQLNSCRQALLKRVMPPGSSSIVILHNKNDKKISELSNRSILRQPRTPRKPTSVTNHFSISPPDTLQLQRHQFLLPSFVSQQVVNMPPKRRRRNATSWPSKPKKVKIVQGLQGMSQSGRLYPERPSFPPEILIKIFSLLDEPIMATCFSLVNHKCQKIFEDEAPKGFLKSWFPYLHGHKT